MRTYKADSDFVRKTAFLDFSSHKWMVFLWHSVVLGLQLCSLSIVSHGVLTQRMEVCLKHHVLRFLWRFQLNHQCRCVSRMPMDHVCNLFQSQSPTVDGFQNPGVGTPICSRQFLQDSNLLCVPLSPCPPCVAAMGGGCQALPRGLP